MGFTGLRYLEYNCNGVDFMESIEMIFNNALKLLENEDYKKCKEYLKEMKEKIKKSNTEKKLEYLAILENSLK